MSYSSDAKRLLKFAGIDIYTRRSSSPISLSKIGKKLGLRYKKMPLHQNTGGMLVRSNIGPYIVINENHPYTRRRFSSAHEIGHYMLGHDSDISIFHDQDRWEEVQANKYASCLLMPDELLYNVHKECRSIREIAIWFRVSPIAVAIRCSQFGLRMIEAEFVRNEYFHSIDEIAVSVERARIQREQQEEQRKKRNESLRREIESRSRLRAVEAQRERNQEMVDRWRRIYGYE
ncbi:ImmA/IrrE family metallo-endopeptidase [Cohnella xylanilytica]|uniref:ImmA/IrrE family metallo-endopeptidase n=1 Tax=Cohnella xylanilytica TaxID=557555 RepID=A0A841TSX6_9BACL|nr:ImmA/IrrE family metallo-endopeptidase [Cohnella xylanilytica]MBB6689952.1 ImmA/IrrE family metallo-endopeptidase [Cohnella xylanilytica]